ncbi:MAG: SulP family inorganic anion transporter [Litoreibacter sp.]|nr:SulP family inorganic anion transporter [Litoreibacter sp.]
MRRIAQPVLGALFAALVSAAFVISYAAIIYTGPLAVFLENGIAFTLLGAAVISSIGAFTLSYRGTILGPQDLPAILLASGASAIAVQSSLPTETLLATVASLVAVTSIVTGTLGFVLGRVRLAYLARLFPYPVLAGFLATTGVFLLLGGIEVAMGPTEVTHLREYLSADAVLRWAPVLAIACAMTAATRVLSGYLVLPLTLMASLLAFYALYFGMGMNQNTLEARGLLLGPFREGGFAGALDPGLPFKADWGVIAAQAPLILTIALSTLIGTALNASGLELALKRDFDLNQELRGNGLANILSGLCGGLPGYHVVGETLLANRLGLDGKLAGLSAGAGCLAVLVLGGSALGTLPVGFFAAIIAFLGIDLLVTWLWVERKRLGKLDFATLVFIPLIAVGYGFLTAIAVGLLLACVLFIMEYGRLGIIRLESDLTTRRSLVERPDTEVELLATRGERTLVVELATYLFFGTSGLLRSKVQERLARSQGLDWLILDFKHVPGMDISARQVLHRISEDCGAEDVRLVLTDLPTEIETSTGVLRFDSLSDGIEHIEESLIDDVSIETHGAGREILELFAPSSLDGFTKTIALQAGGDVLEEAGPSRDIYVLLKGQLRVVAGDARQVIAYIRPGAFVGEMSHYTGAARSAALIADMPSELLRIDSKKLAQLEIEHPAVAAKFHRLVARDMARRLNRTTSLLHAFGA